MAKTHFLIQRADLVRELALISNVVERKTTIPILSNLKIEASPEGRLVLTGTDLEIALVSGISADVKAPGVATLPAKRLLDYVRLLPEGSVEFKFGENNWVTISAGRSKTRIAGMGADSFPEVPKTAPSLMTIPLVALARMIEQTGFAISREESRFTLNGALIETSGDTLRMVATDGHRMALAESVPGGTYPTFRALLPRRAMNELARLSSVTADSAAVVDFAHDENHYFLTVGDRRLTVRRMSGNFPDYQRVMPKEPKATAVVNVAELKAAIGRACLMADERSRAVSLTFADGEVTVSSATTETGEAQEGVSAEYAGEEMKVGLNAGYVSDFLSAVATERATVALIGADSAVVFSPFESAAYKCVVMPMRI